MFPYRLQYKLQDQFDEILAIDTNATLDVYATVSRDGTVSVRCQRTSKLWYHFKLFCDQTSSQGKVQAQKIFKKIVALKLS